MRTFLTLLLLVLSAVACGATTRVGRGQLYTPGETKYDAYFKRIHELQLAAASWPDDKRNARKPLIAAFQMPPDASDGTLARTTQDRAQATGANMKLEVNGENATVQLVGSHGDPMFKAVEETARNEIDRVRRMRALEPKLEELGRQADALSESVEDAFRDADKQREVRNELSECRDVLRQLAVAAKRQARDGEDFVADLQRALSGESTLKHGDTRGFDKPSDRLVASSTSPPSPTPQPAPSPPPAPKPAGTVIDLDDPSVAGTAQTSQVTQPPLPPPPPPPPPPPTATTTTAMPPPPPPPSTAKPKPKPKPGGGRPKPKPKPGGGGGEVFNP
jgi:hypothetical protein